MATTSFQYQGVYELASCLVPCSFQGVPAPEWGSGPAGPGRKWHHNPRSHWNRMTDTRFWKHYFPLRSVIKDYVDMYLLDASVSSSVSGSEATCLETRRQTLFPSVKKGSSAWRHLVTGLYNHGCSLGFAEVCVLSELTSIYVCCYLNFVKQKKYQCRIRIELAFVRVFLLNWSWLFYC